MRKDKNNEKHIFATKGKVLRRKSSGELMGTEIYLGYSYYIGGKKLDEPHEDVIGDFDEVADPEAEAASTAESTSAETEKETEKETAE